jgi:sec-independent protein translocase protein TatC
MSDDMITPDGETKAEPPSPASGAPDSEPAGDLEHTPASDLQDTPGNAHIEEPAAVPFGDVMDIPGAVPSTEPEAATESATEGSLGGEADTAAGTTPGSQLPENSNPKAGASVSAIPKAGTGKASTATQPPEPAVMPLMEHLKELRSRLMWAMVALFITTAISFVFAKQVLVVLIAPMGDSIPQALKPTESLGNYMKVALICGVTLAMPMIVYQIGRFLAPGLTKQEKRWLFLLVPGATLCFVLGVAFAYFVMLPTAIPFLQGFMSDIIEQSWAIGEYLSFVTSLLFWIGVAFELPLFVFFLAKLGIVNPEMLAKNRKYAYLGIAVIAAVITPTVDPLNMMLVMGPLIVLYELGVILAKIA